MKCDTCDRNIDQPNSLTIKHWGGREVAVLCCDACIFTWISVIKQRVDDHKHKPKKPKIK